MNRKQRRAQQKQNKKKVERNVSISKKDEQRLIEKTLKQFEEKYVEAQMKGIRYATTAMFAVFAVTLHDKWGWGQKRTKRLFEQINETFNAVEEGYVKIEELIEIVYDELGIELK